MNCPKCGANADFAEWLKRVNFANSAKKWICTNCPACGESYEIRLQKDGAVIGVMEGAPGPYFIPYATHKVPGLSAAWSAERVEIRYGGWIWTFPTHRALGKRRRRRLSLP